MALRCVLFTFHLMVYKCVYLPRAMPQTSDQSMIMMMIFHFVLFDATWQKNNKTKYKTKNNSYEDFICLCYSLQIWLKIINKNACPRLPFRINENERKILQFPAIAMCLSQRECNLFIYNKKQHFKIALPNALISTVIFF